MALPPPWKSLQFRTYDSAGGRFPAPRTTNRRRLRIRWRQRRPSRPCRIDCCDYKIAAAGKGAKVECADGGRKKTVFAWKGAWPPNPNRGPLQSEMKKSFDEGMTLYKAGKLDAAQPLLCRYKAAMGNTHNPEFVNACATVHLRLKHLGEAQSTLENGIDEHRGWPASATSATRYVLDGAEIVTYA